MIVLRCSNLLCNNAYNEKQVILLEGKKYICKNCRNDTWLMVEE
jgi:hypothetical protein